MIVFLAFFGLLVLLGLAAVTVLGIVTVLLLGALTTSGIIAASVLVGLYKNSIKSGLYTALLLAMASSSIVICCILGLLISFVFHYPLTLSLFVGAGVGLLIFYPAYLVVKWAIGWVLNLFDINHR